MCLNIDKYCEYFSEEELFDDLDKNNLKIENILELNLPDLFEFSLNNGLVNLVEYLYVIEGIGYELNTLLSKNKLNINSDEKNNLNNNTNLLKITEIYDAGAKSGLTLEYLDNKDNKIQKCIKKLVSLRKYSIMTSKDKKFYYKFNPKYIDKVF